MRISRPLNAALVVGSVMDVGWAVTRGRANSDHADHGLTDFARKLSADEAQPRTNSVPKMIEVAETGTPGRSSARPGAVCPVGMAVIPLRWRYLGFLLFGLLLPAAQIRAEPALDLASFGAQVAAELSTYAERSFIAYTSKIEGTAEDQFMAATGLAEEYRHGIRTVEFRADRERYLWKTRTDYDSGKRDQIQHGAWSGNLMQLLTFDEQSTLMVTKNRWSILGSTFVDSNSFFLPFAFLTPHGDLDNKVACSLNELATPDALRAAWARAVTIERSNLGETPCYVIEFTAEDHTDVVYFQASKPFFPIGNDRLRSDGTIHRRYRVGELVQAPGGGPWYPRDAVQEWYVPLGKTNMKTFTNRHRIEELSVVAPTEPVNFLLDARDAQRLFDRDTKTWIKLK